jgi:hypothetical protein
MRRSNTHKVVPTRTSFQRAIYFAILGASLSGSSSAQATQRVADLAAIEDRVQAVYRQVRPAIVRFEYGKDRKSDFGKV